MSWQRVKRLKKYLDRNNELKEPMRYHRSGGNPADVAAGKLDLTTIRAEISNVHRHRAASDPHTKDNHFGSQNNTYYFYHLTEIVSFWK